mmetsp:Transcript_27206/g.48868  ORF Transcript_27206/g.48868 Transcript_27206/m.48868 type:complete len:369 (-) Transcript_27206:4389-5495(-)
MRLDFIFESKQPLRIEIYDFDVRESDYLGGVNTFLGTIVGALHQTQILDLKTREGRDAGKIILRVEEVKGTLDSIYLELGARGVEDVDIITKSDPFLVFCKGREDGSWLKVHTTEFIANNLNPVWRAFNVPVQLLCNGDFFKPIRIELMDHERSGRHQYIGATETTVNDLLLHDGRTFAFINPKRLTKKKYVDSGQLYIRQSYLIKEFSFLQYLQGNCNISLMFAIDFTGSNGSPTSSSSLHYLSSSMNEYERALSAVGEILINYNHSNLITAWGFGGMPFSGVPTSHCFPLNGNPKVPETLGVGGLMEAYRNCLQRVTLDGPTRFTSILEAAMQKASQPWPAEEQHYSILFILTDGQIHDYNETVSM